MKMDRNTFTFLCYALIFVFLAYILGGHTAHPSQPDERDYGRTCLALAMFSEARSEGEAAMYEVGLVALRRSLDPHHRWPQSLCGVIEEVEQFQGVSHWHYPRRPDVIDADSWERSMQIAEKVIAHGMGTTGPCSGALFFNQHGNSSAPNFKCQLGALYFYGDML